MEGIKKNKKITVYGKGNQMRDYLYVTDACIAIEKALNYNKSEVFNISSPLRLSVSDIIQHLKKKYAFEIEYKEKENNLESVTLNIDKARKELGFAPKIVSLQIS